MARLVARGIEKSFGATRALVGVDLSIEAGEVHALLGENGAGKSTLMGVLAGAHPADRGTLELDGAPYAPSGPRAAWAAGVAIVHQELSLCPHLTVEENLLLGDEPLAKPSFLGIAGFVDRRRARDRATRALDRVGGRKRSSPISLDDRVSDLSPAAQQLVEIARALARGEAQGGPRVLILDEPTSSLGAEDAEQLFALVRELRDAGISVVYISHFLEEITQIADRFTVLRDGATVSSGRVADTTIDALVSSMAGRAAEGRSLERIYPRSERTPGDVLLEVRALSRPPRPLDVNLTVRRGEVLGIAGLVGAGRTELLRAVFGLDRVASGEVRVGAWIGPRSPADALDHGVGLLSEDRKGEGLALELSIAENLALSKLPRVVRPSSLAAIAREWVERLGIRASDVDAPVRELSGGNQQKVALARLLHHDVDVLLLDEPTRGIDVRSKAQIYERIDALARAGKAIVVVSSWLPELVGICDRVAVMCRGRLGEARPIAEWTEESILRAAVGA